MIMRTEADVSPAAASGFSRLLKPLTSSGFTLIEITVVLALIALILSLVLPRIPLSEREHLKHSARTLAATLRYVQQRAAAGHTPYILRVTPGSDEILLFERGGDGGDKLPGDPLLRKRQVHEGIMVADIMTPRLGCVRDGQVRLPVGPEGFQELVMMHLRSSGGETWTIAAFPAGGKVKLYEGYREEPL